MAPIVIEVSGSASKSVPAERCTLSLSVSHQSTDQTAVHDSVTNASNELSTYLNQMAPQDTSDDGHRGITKWSMGRLSTYSWERAIGTVGTQKERLHSARTTFSLTFRDFELMSKICLDVSTNEYFTIDRMYWHITQDARDSVQRGVRQAALKDAVTKAGDYASLFYHPDNSETVEAKLVPIRINDGSGAASSGWGGGNQVRAAGMFGGSGPASSGRPALEFHPEDITVSATVNCVFHFDPVGTI